MPNRSEPRQEQQQLQEALDALQTKVLDLTTSAPMTGCWPNRIPGAHGGPHAVARTRHRSAITLLGNADERIKALNDPSLMPIRKALAEDIASLKGMPRVDREGLTLKLAAPRTRSSCCPPPSACRKPRASPPTRPSAPTRDERQSNLKKNWVQFTENSYHSSVAAMAPPGSPGSRSRRSSWWENLADRCRPSSPSIVNSSPSMSTAWRRPSAG